MNAKDDPTSTHVGCDGYYLASAVTAKWLSSRRRRKNTDSIQCGLCDHFLTISPGEYAKRSLVSPTPAPRPAPKPAGTVSSEVAALLECYRTRQCAATPRSCGWAPACCGAILPSSPCWLRWLRDAGRHFQDVSIQIAGWFCEMQAHAHPFPPVGIESPRLSRVAAGHQGRDRAKTPPTPAEHLDGAPRRDPPLVHILRGCDRRGDRVQRIAAGMLRAPNVLVVAASHPTPRFHPGVGGGRQNLDTLRLSVTLLAPTQPGEEEN